MSEHPHKKNRQPVGTPPNQRRLPKPGRNRPAKHYDVERKVWGYDVEQNVRRGRFGRGE